MKRANTDRTAFKERDDSDLLPSEGPLQKDHYSENDSSSLFTDDPFTPSVSTEKKRNMFSELKHVFTMGDDFAMLYKSGVSANN